MLLERSRGDGGFFSAACGWLRRASCRTCRFEDAFQLVHLYAERGSPKYEKAALRWLEQYLDEGAPTLHQFAEVTAILAAKDPTAP